MTPQHRASVIVDYVRAHPEIDRAKAWKVVFNHFEAVMAAERERVYRSFAEEIEASKGPRRTHSDHSVTEHCDQLIKLANERAGGEKKKLVYDPDDPDTKWIVTLAEGFKRAGAKRSPLVPEPEVIEECIRTAIDQSRH